jgi:hypothetical protein
MCTCVHLHNMELGSHVLLFPSSQLVFHAQPDLLALPSPCFLAAALGLDDHGPVYHVEKQRFSLCHAGPQMC